ncbi:MAG: B12-binding domain-containing radical SAM protein [Candidatus Poribacteria bacterium]|nr:B12-binding domain-containing radical SAM protein [Candidatus Poribacteria bacterium]
MPNALFVYPKFPPSYWGFKYALDFLGKKSSMPPLGLLTIAGMFPDNYNLKVVDMNIDTLTDEHLDWADMVLTSTMIVQKGSLYEVVERCNRADVPIIAGGPHPTSYYDNIKEECDGTVDHFLFGEVEEIFEDFLTDFESGSADEVYKEQRKPDITITPPPRYDLIDIHAYGSMALQFSRGCPFNCEFCDITKLFGRVPRTKSNEQMLAEFEMLYKLGWKGAMFVVDDNFIGNKRDAMRLLPAVQKWQEERDFPFTLYTEASVNLVEIPEMLDAMSSAGFNMVFLGIETPNEDALITTSKGQNTSKEEDAGSYLLQAIRKIQHKGMEVTGGFIIGLDGDTEFDSHIKFIQEAGIPMAMAGLLTALKETDLWHRLKQEDRLLIESSGNNTDMSLNFVPEMPREKLIREYRRVISTLYDPTLKNYFERCYTLLKHMPITQHNVRSIHKGEVRAFFVSLKKQIFSRQGYQYAKFVAKVIKNDRRLFPEAIRLAVMGYHLEKITRHTVAVEDFRNFLAGEIDSFKEKISQFVNIQGDRIQEIEKYAKQLSRKVKKEYESIHIDFQYAAHNALVNFHSSLFKEYLEVELTAFKEAVAAFAKAQSERINELQAYVSNLFTRVHAQQTQLHADFTQNIQETFDAFKESISSYLEQRFGSIPFQIEELQT